MPRAFLMRLKFVFRVHIRLGSVMAAVAAAAQAAGLPEMESFSIMLERNSDENRNLFSSSNFESFF